ncbi:hypothetical protein G9A89_015739, partial [Geosiphon pyriformis]
IEHSIEDSLLGGIPAIKLRKKLMKLRFWEAMDKTITIEFLSIIQRTQPNPSNTKLSDIKPSDHQQQEETSTNKHYPKISSLLETLVNTESARETFYRELIQNTKLPTNHNFAFIITEINKKIEHHTQQKYPITYASKGKRKLQTPAVTPKKIQPTTWKKTRVESPTVLSYHYILGSTINITLANASTSNAISTFGQFPFQNFGTTTLWELSEKKEEEESEDQEFTYQNPILENPEFGTPNVQTPEIKTLNIQTPQNQNPEPIQIPNQQTQQPPPVPPQQQQLLPQQQQQIAYAPIVKLDKFTGEEDDTQVWLNNDTADLWYQSLVDKPQDFNAFKLEFLRYFSNNNNINRLANTFTTIKQKETEAVTTYLGRFYRNLQQIQAIDGNYFTAPQILNQFICGLHSSILQHDTVIHARNFESAKLEVNYTHTVNLVMNRSSELDSKLKQFSDSINQKLEEYLADNHTIYQPPQQCNNPGNANCFQNQLYPSSLSAAPNQPWQPEMCVCHNCGNQGYIRADCKFYSNNPRSGNQYQNLNRRFQTPNRYPNQDQTTYLPMMQPPIY